MKKIIHSLFLLSLLVGLTPLVHASNESYLDYLKGLSEERAGHIAKALDAYEKVVRQDPQALEVFRDIADAVVEITEEAANAGV